MGLGAEHLAVVPARPLAAGHDPDPLPFGLEDRPLLDVQLEQGADRSPADRPLAGIADPLQLLADRPAGVILTRETVVEVEHAGEHARGDHRRREAAALLVGPVDHLEGCAGLDALVIEGADHLERAEHAERAVELAAGRLAVEMAAEQHGRAVLFGPLASGEHGAHPIDADREPGLVTPSTEQIAAPPVLVGQRLTVDATVRRRADFGHGHQALPEPLAVHVQFSHLVLPLLVGRQPHRAAADKGDDGPASAG